MPAVLVAHPLSPIADLGAPPLAVALGAAVVAAAVLLYASQRAAADPPAEDPRHDRALSPRWTVATRALAVALLAFLGYAGRFGDPDEVDNVASVFVMGLAWPLLLVAALLLGRALWRALDPWDALVRATEGGRQPDPGPPASVYAAVPVAVVVATYANGYLFSKTPASVWVALVGYTLAAVVVGIAFGRDALARVEVVGLAAAWTGRWRRRGLVSWRPPRGAEAVLGALLGGMLYAEVSVSEWWVRRTFGPDRARWSLLAAAACAVAGAAVLHGLGRWAAARGAEGSVAAALVPLLPAYAVATQARRIVNAAQIFVQVVSDPLGRGWDLFGTADRPVRVGPSVLQLRWFAAAVLCLAGVLGALVLARRVRDRGAQDPAAAALYLAVGVAVFAVTTTVA